MELTIPYDNPAEPPMYRSRYGGLWVDRRDAHEILADRQDRGLITGPEGEAIAQYIDHGYVIFPKAVDEAVVDEYLDFFEEAWDHPPSTIWAHSGGATYPMSRDLYDKVAKVSSLHTYFPRAGELIFPAPVLRFLTQIYDRPPVAFQTMSMRWGSEEPLHIDTGPLSLTEPMTMAASWVALEDVQESSGEFEYVPGSHRLPELLHHGNTKAHYGDFAEYGRILAETREMCEERGLKTERFMARKGDVLIWHADLMHGGAVIEDHARTRKSLVAHYMPLGVMPTFQDFSDVSEFTYPGGGNCTDALLTARQLRQAEAAAEADGDGPASTKGASGIWNSTKVQEWKQQIPLPVRTFARKNVDKVSAYLK
jgi:phytanoyl-CoA hydroxylase